MSQTSGILERELLAMRPGKYFQFIKLLSFKKKKSDNNPLLYW